MQTNNQNYPHYDVQRTIFSLLMSAVDISLRFEIYEDALARQSDLVDLIEAYAVTVEQAYEDHVRSAQMPGA